MGVQATPTKAGGQQPRAARAKRPPCAAHGSARSRPFDPRDPLGRLLLALEVDPCDCRHEHPAGATAWHADPQCLRWHVLPAAHRLHPDDWLRLLRAWSEEDFGEAAEAAPAVFKAEVAGLSEHEAGNEARRARLAVYEERARLRQGLFCREDAQEATAADLGALGLVPAAEAFLASLEEGCAA